VGGLPVSGSSPRSGAVEELVLVLSFGDEVTKALEARLEPQKTWAISLEGLQKALQKIKLFR
jgi:hypothetical protein